MADPLQLLRFGKEEEEKQDKPRSDVENVTNLLDFGRESTDLPEEFRNPPQKQFNNQAEAETEETLSFSQLSSDREYMDMLRDYGVKGNLGKQKDDESDEQYLKRFLTHTREFEFNSIDLGRQLDWVRNANQEERMQFGYLYQQLGRLPSFYQEGGTGYGSAI